MPDYFSASGSPWMVYVAFWLSLILTVLKIIEFAFKAISSPKLDIQLTKDAFFRLTDLGETIFCSPVLIAWNGAVLIVGATAKLQKVNQPEKLFCLEILAYGEKVRGTNTFADHYFPTRSPLTYVPASVPQRAVYFCVQENYRNQAEQSLAAFRAKVLDYKTQLIQKFSAHSPTDADRASIAQELERFVTETVSDCMDIVQLEAGHYKLTVNVAYQNPSARIFKTTKECTSAITFTVGKEVRDLLRTNLRQTLRSYATNLVFDRNDLVTYPEYTPLEVAEVR